MTPRGRWGLCAATSIALFCGFSACRASESVADVIASGRTRSRQMRFDEASALLTRALTMDGTREQNGYAHLMLGVIAHQRRELDDAAREYGRALELAATDPIRTTVHENLALLAADRARFESWGSLRDRLDLWLAAEAATGLLLAAAFFRFTRPRV